MTTAYLKDLHHLREMYTLKIENPEVPMYEVNYYDAMANLDPDVRSFVDN